MSPRNSPAAVCAMLKATNCRRIIHHSYTADLVTQVTAMMSAQGIGLQLDDLPSYGTVFPAQTASPTDFDVHLYPHLSHHARPNRVAIYMHSSGSTGTPKSVPFTEKRVWEWHGPYVDGQIST